MDARGGKMFNSCSILPRKARGNNGTKVLPPAAAFQRGGGKKIHCCLEKGALFCALYCAIRLLLLLKRPGADMPGSKAKIFKAFPAHVTQSPDRVECHTRVVTAALLYHSFYLTNYHDSSMYSSIWQGFCFRIQG